MTASRLIPHRSQTDLVTCTVHVNGAAIPRQFGILALSVQKEINRIPTARIQFIDGDPERQKFDLSNDPLLAPGSAIEILLGYNSQEDLIFKGIITKQSIKIRRGGAQLTVECKDEAVKLTVGTKNANFFEQTDSDALSAMLGAYGLATDIASTSVTHPVLVQTDASDWQFLLDRIEANGMICRLDDGALTVEAPSLPPEPALDVVYGATLEELDLDLDARDQYASVVARGWQPGDQAVVEAEAADPGIAEPGNLAAADLAAVIGLERYLLNHTGAVDQSELQAWADAFLLRTRLAKIRGRVRFQGFAGVKPGDSLRLDGVGDVMNGIYYVSGIRHDLSGGNWYTDAQLGLAPPERMPAALPTPPALVPAFSGLQTGVVTALEDPDGEDRIRVRLPMINADDDGVWARLATLDAGDQRGLVFRPEIGDEVVVGLLNNDPRFPVVLGALHSSAKPAPLPGSDDNHEKAIVSREDIRIVFNDEKKHLHLLTPGGNKIEISDENKGLVLQDQNGNKIVLDDKGISLESAKDLTLKTSAGDIKLEALNIEQKAQVQFKAEGTAGLEVSSSAIAKLKGSLVQIN